MKFLPTDIPEVILIEPDVFKDARGFFLETFHERKYAEGGIPGPFVQDNHSYSARGTLRGLHAQLQHPQGKLVRAVEGEMFDVAVDIRRARPRSASGSASGSRATTSASSGSRRVSRTASA